MTILYALLVLLLAVLVTTINSLYDFTIVIHLVSLILFSPGNLDLMACKLVILVHASGTDRLDWCYNLASV